MRPQPMSFTPLNLILSTLSASEWCGNMNYLLDPNYAAAQVFSEEENEYQTFSKYNKQ